MKQLDLERLYREAGRSLRSDLLSIDLAKFDDNEANRIRRRTSLTVSALNLACVNWTGSALKGAAEKAKNRTIVALEILGRRPMRPQITDPGYNAREKALETMVKANRSIRDTVDRYLSVSLLAAFKARTAKVQEFKYSEAEEQLDALALKALKAEQSRGWLMRKIIDFLRGLIGNDEFIEINGRTYKMSKYAKMVARTELKKARTEAKLDLCRQYDHDLIQVSDHGTVCEVCQEIEGNIYSISGKHPKYPAMPIKFPPHPNCMHEIFPASEIAIEISKQYETKSVLAKWTEIERGI